MIRVSWRGVLGLALQLGLAGCSSSQSTAPNPVPQTLEPPLSDAQEQPVDVGLPEGKSGRPRDPDPLGYRHPPVLSNFGPLFNPLYLEAPAANPQISAPPKFRVSLFAEGMHGPRHMARREDEVWVADRGDHSLRRWRDVDDDGYAETADIPLDWDDGLFFAHGTEYHDGWIYFSVSTTVYRFRDDDRDGHPDEAPEGIVTDLPPYFGHHNTRSLAIDPRNAKLYVSAGATWDHEPEPEPVDPHRAAVWQYNLDGSAGRLFATGLRNAVAMDFDTAGGLWVVNNGVGHLGDLVPRESMWRLTDGGFYGHPFAYTHNGEVVVSPPDGPSHLDEVARTIPALFEFDAHAAPLGLTFWQGTSWGAGYEGNMFVAFHGSAGPQAPTGYEVLRVRFDADGRPVDSEVFLGNFRLAADIGPVGRPVHVLQYGNALLVSDDFAGVIYRVDKVE